MSDEGGFAGFSADYLTESPSGVDVFGWIIRIFLVCGGCFCLWRVLLHREGGFAGFSADYLTEPPSRDETTLPSRVGVARTGSFLPRWRVILSGEGAITRFFSSCLTKVPSRNRIALRRQNYPPNRNGFAAATRQWTKITSGWMVTLLLGAVKLLTICSRPLGASNFSIRPRPQGSSVEKE